MFQETTPEGSSDDNTREEKNFSFETSTKFIRPRKKPPIQQQEEKDKNITNSKQKIPLSFDLFLKH